MIDLKPAQTYIFVIDTEQYAGNFERPMCAYITGRTGDCGVGDEEAEVFNKEMNVDEYALDNEIHPFQFVIGRADEHGCSRPVTIYPTPTWFNNGLGGEFRDGQESEALIHYREQCLKESERLYVGDKAAWEQKAKNAKLQKHPSYQSVAIFMERQPTVDEWRILEERAGKFPAYWLATKPSYSSEEERLITITGFRLILEDTRYVCVKEQPAHIKTLRKMS